MTVTVWRDPQTLSVKLHQLSDDPDDGTSAEQIAHLGEAVYSGFECVSEDYTGSVPDTDPATWRWVGEAVTALPSIPEYITPVQLRLTLSIYGLLPAVEAEVAKLGEVERIYWQYATAIRRDNPILLGMATKMNLTKEQVDEMFIFAAGL